MKKIRICPGKSTIVNGKLETTYGDSVLEGTVPDGFDFAVLAKSVERGELMVVDDGPVEGSMKGDAKPPKKGKEGEVPPTQ